MPLCSKVSRWWSRPRGWGIGRVEIVDGQDIFYGPAAEFVGGTVADSALYAGSGHPCGEAIGIVVAAEGAVLEHRHAAEFAAPDDERFFEQPAPPEVAELSVVELHAVGAGRAVGIEARR